MTMRPLTDRERVERLVPVLLVIATVEHGVSDKTAPDHVQVLAWLSEAKDEALAGLPLPLKAKVLRRALRLSDAILSPQVAEETDCGKFALTLYHLMAGLLDQGVPVMAEGSAFERAMHVIIGDEGTVAEMANQPRLNASAAKQARRLMAQMQQLGLYQLAGRVAA